MSTTPPRFYQRRLPRILLVVVAVVLLLVMAVVVAFQLSPWPGVLLIRATPGADGLSEAAAIEKYVPAGMTSILDELYSADGPDARLDVFFPETATGPLPTIVWVHGGSFVSGIKEPLRNYLKILASHGYTTVNVEYCKAPECRYPTPVLQLNQVLQYLERHAGRLRVDMDQIVLGGDSAGAHIVAQTALAVHDSSYAQAAGLPAAVSAGQIRGVILVSGPYDMRKIDVANPQWGRFLRTVLWAYSGKKDFLEDSRFAYASLTEHVGPHYPPAFITTGPSDPLLVHSMDLARALAGHGVAVDTLFFDPGTADPSIGHEYQLSLDAPEAREAMKGMVAFMRARTHTPLRLQGVSDGW